MPVQIVVVKDRKSLKSFVEFPNKLFKGNPSYVPALYQDEMDAFTPGKNPATEFCEVECYLAVKDGQTVGRVAAIVNHRANSQWNHNEVRFGWFDFIDDREVSSALLDKVIEFGKSRSMDKICGPLGFTDFDPEGMLVEGFDRMGTMALCYAYPYYKEHMEALGYEKDIDWLEYRINIPESLPDKYGRVASVVTEKYGLRVRKLTKKEIFKKNWGNKVFHLINDTYAKLYDFTILPQGMIDLYVKKYLSLIDLRFISVVVDSSDEIVAFGISMPSIVKALQKCGGKLFPLGWWYLLRSMYLKYEDTIELLLIGVKEEYRNKGVNALIFSSLVPLYNKYGFKYAETNAELENNHAVQAQWTDLEFEQMKRRRVFLKNI